MMGRATQSDAGASLAEIERVYRQRAVAFERVAAAIVRDREVAADVVQDAFVTAVLKRGGFGRRGSVEAWIWRVVVNTARNRLKAGRRKEAGTLSEIAARDGHAEEKTLNQQLPAPLEALPERQRLVIFLRYYADLDYRTIGAVLGISAGTVGSTLNSAHQTLRRHLAEEGKP